MLCDVHKNLFPWHPPSPLALILFALLPQGSLSPKGMDLTDFDLIFQDHSQSPYCLGMGVWFDIRPILWDGSPIWHYLNHQEPEDRSHFTSGTVVLILSQVLGLSGLRVLVTCYIQRSGPCLVIIREDSCCCMWEVSFWMLWHTCRNV